MLIIAVDHERLIGLAEHAVDFLNDDLGARNREFESFAAHGLDEYRQVEFATARHFVFIGRITRLDPQCYVKE